MASHVEERRRDEHHVGSGPALHVCSPLADWSPFFSRRIGTHADSLLATAFSRNVTGFDKQLAWEAVLKDATVPPADDLSTQYGDREENVGYEVRAGLTSFYETHGYVANELVRPSSYARARVAR